MENYKDLFLQELKSNYKMLDWKNIGFGGRFKANIGTGYEVYVGQNEYGTEMNIKKQGTDECEVVCESTDDRVKGFYEIVKMFWKDQTNSGFWKDAVEELKRQICYI